MRMGMYANAKVKYDYIMDGHFSTELQAEMGTGNWERESKMK